MAETTAAKNKGVMGFLKGVRSEFKKIVWPHFDVLMKQTGIVIVVSLIIGLLVAGIDWIFGTLVNLILG
jgi:preprotein translocase subunit SecE